MGNQQTALTKRNIDTPSGRISYTEAGSGPVALFVALLIGSMPDPLCCRCSRLPAFVPACERR